MRQLLLWFVWRNSFAENLHKYSTGCSQNSRGRPVWAPLR